MEKKVLSSFIVLGILFLALSMAAVSAIDLDVKAKPIQDNVILDLNEPASYELSITNLEDSDSFKIFSFIGLDITPTSSFSIAKGETKVVRIQVTPQDALKSKRHLTFEYKIQNSKNEMQAEQLTIDIINLKDAFDIVSDPINPQSQTESVSIKNKLNYDFGSINADLNSVFFNYKESFNLGPGEVKVLSIPLDKDKVKVTIACIY